MPTGSVVYNRADRVNFMGLTADATTFNRMTGFTESGNTLNTNVYERRYVDEKSSRKTVTGYAKEIGYTFDRFTNNDVQNTIAEVHDLEKTDVILPIITVDFNQPGTASGTYKAIKRMYSIIPDADGDGTDAYQYSGTFGANGEIIEGIATVAADGQTCSFTPDVTPSV